MEPLHFTSMDTTPFTPDCTRCDALCCTALYFAKTEGFPYNKAAGAPCQNLLPNGRCRVHDTLIEKGLKGCLAFDCLGAGPAATAYCAPHGWREPGQGAAQFAAFDTLLQLYAMRWYLTEALTLAPLRPLEQELRAALKITVALCASPPTDLAKHRALANRPLKRSCGMIQRYLGVPERSGPADCMGQSFAGQTLTGQDWSMCLLIAADLSGCTLTGTNFLGADVRNANVAGADLRQSVYLTQAQLNTMRGDSNTRLPAHLHRPLNWIG